MARRIRLVCFFTFTALCIVMWCVDVFGPWFQPLALLPNTARIFPAAELRQPAGTCAVSPLYPIEDAAALKIEASVTSTIDVDDMKPATFHALDRFESNIAAAGGTLVLKSAYRPAAYQQHLQNVWYTWMHELRDNQEPGCQDLRAQVQGEFLRHHLIETQHPVSASDHTRGLAFDATVDLPSHARLGRRPVNVDTLAHLAGLLRPAIGADPVHFKYVGGVSPRPMRRKRNA